MKGLRTKEGSKFEKFFEEVQKEAEKQNSVFFLNFGECKDIEFKDMVVDDLFGWLIPNRFAPQFKKAFEKNDILKTFDEFLIWCIPEIKNNELTITFKTF
ncbi:hypothetical protein SAMN02910327_00413 [Peptostreptococcaceae bacterium pGA-8]|nr:hypothetical protein SAMN02910327_00413 [Peptostreptococcaceae bacterium pGA-8]